MAGRYGGGLACVISWPLLSAEKVSRPREESARHQLHKSDPFPPRNVDPSWEMAQFVRDLQEEFCETLSNFYHTLQEPYDDTVLGPAKFRNHMIFLGFKRQHPACWGASLAPPPRLAGPPCPLVAHGLDMGKRPQIGIFNPFPGMISCGRSSDLEFPALKP